MPDLSLTRDGMTIGGVLLRWYGLIVVAATLAGILVAARLAKRASITPEHVWRAALWILPLGLAGARLWYVLFPPETSAAIGRTREWMLAHPFDLNQGAIAVWMGGLGLFGGLIGGALGLWLYIRRATLPGQDRLRLLDIAALALTLGLSLGRWGDGANQEVYGPPTALPWGQHIDNAAARVPPYDDVAAYPLDATRFHPVWLYESVFAALLFAGLLWLAPRGKRRPGHLAALALIGYCGGRFFLEMLRLNVSWLGGVNVSQAACVVGVAVGLILMRRFGWNDGDNAAEAREWT